MKDKKLYDREYYAKRSPKAKARKIRLQKERRQKIRMEINEYKKNHPCKCGESEICCLDFHHNKGEKEVCITNSIREGWNFTRILKEIEKCTILCANCHRKLHVGSNPATKAKTDNIKNHMVS